MFPNNSIRYAQEALRILASNEDFRARVVNAATLLWNGRPAEWLRQIEEGELLNELKDLFATLDRIPRHDEPVAEYVLAEIGKAVADICCFVIEEQTKFETRQAIARGE